MQWPSLTSNHQIHTVMIRKFHPTDLPVVLHLWLEGNLQAHPFISPSYWQNHVTLMKEVLPQAEVYVFVDETTQEIIAFVGMDQNYIAGIFTRKDYRSRGIGKALLQFLKTMKRELTLSVYLKNEEAIRFYKREGFQITEEKVDEGTGEREYQMCLFL